MTGDIVDGWIQGVWEARVGMGGKGETVAIMSEAREQM